MSLKVPLPSSSSCNAVASDQIQPLTPHRRSQFLPFLRRNAAVVLCASSSIAAVGNGGGDVHEGGSRRSWRERLAAGGISKDNLSYKEKFVIRCYEVGINKTATVETIANLLQEVGCNSAQSVGFSTDGFATTPTMRKLHPIWVTVRMHIEVYRYPAWSDVVEIETWCQSEGRINIRRDWLIKDYTTGEVIGRATSKWVMMNKDTRRLQKVPDEVQAEYIDYFSKEPRLVFPEENNASLKKIAKLEDPAQHSHLGLMPRRSDLDMNQHVNHVTYIGWVLESMPQEIINTRELRTITLDYKRECQHSDAVDSLTSVEPVDDDHAVLERGGGNGSAAANIDKYKCQFLHLLRSSSDGLEINRGRTEWRTKSAEMS